MFIQVVIFLEKPIFEVPEIPPFPVAGNAPLYVSCLLYKLEKGFKCSEHEHQYKFNGFFVERGKMIVRVWQTEDQEGLVDETILGPGDFTVVKPGKVHQFEGVDSGVAFELYWAEFDHNDIVRRTVGSKI